MTNALTLFEIKVSRSLNISKNQSCFTLFCFSQSLLSLLVLIFRFFLVFCQSSKIIKKVVKPQDCRACIP